MKFESLSDLLRDAVYEACKYAMELAHEAATNEHLLVILLRNPGSGLSLSLGSSAPSTHDYLVKLLAARPKATGIVEPGVEADLVGAIETAEQVSDGKPIGERDYIHALLSKANEIARYLRSAGLIEHFAESIQSPRETLSPCDFSDSSSNDSAWQLTARMRELVRRVQQEILQPARTTIAESKQCLKSARESMDAALKCVSQAEEKEIRATKEKMEATVKAASAEVESRQSETERLLSSARTHLTGQGVAIGEVPPPLREKSSSGIPNDSGATVRASKEALEHASTILASMRRRVDNVILKTSKPKNPIWPNAELGGCGLLIASVITGGILAGITQSGGGFFLGAIGLYVFVIVLLHVIPFSILSSNSQDLWDDGRQISALLKQYARGITTQAKGEAEKAEKGINAKFSAEKKRIRGKCKAAEELYQSEIEALQSVLRPQVAALHQNVSTFWNNGKFASADWEAAKWQDWAPSSSPAFAARFGELLAETADIKKEIPALDLEFPLPAFAPFADGRCLLFKATGPEKDRAVNAVQSVIGRLLAAVPPGKLRFTFIDPIALGNNAAGFMALADHEESLVTSRAWSEPQHIEQRLGDLTEHMETVIQKYLRTEFKTIHDYNEAAKEVAEAYRFVVVFDFPVNFSDTAARRLVSIARNGARCGVYALIVCDSAKPLPYGFTLAELEQSAAVITRPEKDANSGWRWLDSDFQPWALKLEKPPQKETLSRIVSTVGGLTKEAMRVEVPYDKLLSLANLGTDTFWEANTSKSVRVPLGPTGARKLQYLTLGEGMGHHALIVGRPGSGKSNLMHVIITTLALTYPPDEMRVYLIDFKKGVEFKCYAEHKLPHAEAIAVESEREFGLSVVERLDVELKKRGDLFRNSGAANITEYREKTGVQIPRVLLLVDEFQEFFTQDDHVARQTTLVLDRLVRQGRAFGIHIMLGSQTLAGSYNLSRSTLDQMAVRIAMQCSENDSRLVLSDDNPAARLLSRPGEAIYNAASGLVEGNNLFQVACFSEDDREQRLKLIEKIAKDSGKTIHEPIVFEGNELAPLAACRKLGAFLDSKDWPTKKGVELLLGEPIAIRDPIAARIRRQSGSHLLILSRDEAEGVGMCVASILSILAQQRPGIARVFIADFTLADSEWAERAEEIEEFFPHDVKVLSRQRDVAEAVKNIADEVKRRSEPPLQQSDAEIAKILNTAGIPAKKGGKWYPATVYSVRSYARLADRKTTI